MFIRTTNHCLGSDRVAPGRSRNLGELAVGRDNNMDLVRLACALAVVAGHVYTMDVADTADLRGVPRVLDRVMNVGLDIFFVLSGFLITASMIRAKDARRFVVLRLSRILPALVPAALFCMFIVGPLATTVPLRDYFASSDLWRYLVSAALANPDATLPGVFENAALPGSVNEPTWTLRYEMLMYALVLAAGLAGLLNRAAYAVGAALFAGFYAANATWLHLETDVEAVRHLTRFVLAFGIGAGFWLFRDRVPMHNSILAAFALIAWIAGGTALGPASLTLAAAYGALYVAFLPTPAFAHRMGGDYSYGLYIYHWPVASLLTVLFADASPHLVFAITLPTAAMLAIASWHMVEAPCLAMARGKRVVVQTLRPA